MKYKLGKIFSIFTIILIILMFVWSIFINFRNKEEIKGLKAMIENTEEKKLEYDSFKLNEFNKKFIKDFFTLNDKYTYKIKSDNIKKYLDSNSIYLKEDLIKYINSIDWTYLDVLDSEVTSIYELKDRLRVNTKVKYNATPTLNLNNTLTREQLMATDAPQYNFDEKLENEEINLTYTVTLDNNKDFKVLSLPYFSYENNTSEDVITKELLKEYPTLSEKARLEGVLNLNEMDIRKNLSEFLVLYFDNLSLGKNDSLSYYSKDILRLIDKDLEVTNVQFYTNEDLGVSEIYEKENGYRIVVHIASIYKKSVGSYFDNLFVMDIEKNGKNFVIEKIYRD